ncbi:SDR family NAD(P)-dependent oxidoreductase [Dactylosporangium sp. NPDC050688]|uniref:SDR family NAD(P)-dependent oxidoreductase n=1 Tax=Dactylosporangium sp. NPDC050688 TaxID=3157217 RepID=UPI0033E1719D
MDQRGTDQAAPTPLSRALDTIKKLRAQLDGQGGAQPVAVIGAGLRLPGGIETLDGYWAALTAGRDLVHARPPGRKWPFAAGWDALPNRGGWLEEVLGFDAEFFGISPREARALDPQQRLLLEVSWEALEHAGLPPLALSDVRTGFYLGITNADYRDWEPAGSDVYWATGNGNCFAAGRVAYTLGLTGPAVAVDTACSSSLVAVHQAVQALRRGECEVALAGGVNLLLSPRSTRYGKEMGSLAPDGLCKTFDARANGFTRGEGSGIAVLKRLADAVRDGDRILGVIHGSAVNQDGRSTGFTAPNVLAQVSLIEAALADARLTPADIGMVEAHGTGTALGDPIEMDALATALGRRNGGAPLHTGAVKTNLGHLEAAAGIAGLLKALLCLRHRQIPPLVHFDTLNPRIDLSGTGIAVPAELTGWSPAAGRFAGVSAFGMSGTNAHVVLGPAPDAAPAPATPVTGFEISARDEAALRRLAGRFAAAADALDPADYPAFAYTATHGRTGHPVRATIRAAGPAEAAGALRAIAGGTAGDTQPPAGATPDSLPRRVADLPPYPWRRSRHAPEELDAPIPAYELDWQRLDPAPAAAATPLVVAGDDATVLAPLAEAARAAGRDVTVLGPVPGNAGPVPGDDAEWAAFWVGRPVPAVLALAFTAPALPATGPDTLAGTLAADGARLCAAVTTAVRSLPAGAIAYAVTTGTRAAVPGDVCVPSAHGLVNGLGAVLGLEFPAGWGGLIDLPAGPSAGPSPAGAAALAGLLGATGAEDVLAVRGGAVHTARLRAAAVTAGAGGLPVDGDGTYLITGALGGVGRAVVSDLVARGARHLLLIGRTAAEDLRPAARDALAAWRSAGAGVTYRAADVADPAALAAAAVPPPGAPPVRGIVHAAGTLRETPLSAATEADFAEALGAKYAAAWQLRLLAAEHPVEFVVQLSSVTALWGTAGYGAYAAANGGLDLLAAVPGGPVTRTVAYGPWDVDGMVDAASLSGLARAGVGAVTAPVGCAALGAGLSTGGGHLVVCPVDWDRFTEVTAARRRRALFPGSTTTPPSVGTAPSVPGTAPGTGHTAAAGALATAPGAGPTTAADATSGAAPAPVSATARADLLALPEVARRDAVAGIVTAAVAAVLGHADGRVPSDVGFFDLGLDSMMAVDLTKALAAELGVPATISDVFDHPTAGALADLLTGRLSGLPEPAPVPAPELVAAEPAGPAVATTAPEPVAAEPFGADPFGAEPIAVVGMAGRFPGADSVEEFWALLRDGRDAVGDVPASRWDSAALRADDPLRAGTITTDQGGFLTDVDRFDAGFFGIPAREAENLDPQHRLLLESAWHALESAGTDPSGLAGSRTGVFVGISNSDYGRLLERGGLEGLDAYFGTGTALNAAAGRIAFTLGLRGPALAVDTACSSSLVAVHLAIRSLRQGESDRAIAGGVNVIAAPTASVAVSRAHMLSPEGRCKTFSAAADGFVRSEGVGVLVLRRLADARRDGDPILAVLHGSAVNSDGASSGLTVPSGRAQEDVIAAALADARVAPADIDLLEAHGTGTSLGDPIELAAAWSVLRRGRAPGRPLHLGSVKSVVGHCESAAGVVALIKTVLALRHGQLPPNLHCAELNPHVPWQDMNVRVVDTLQPWRRGDGPRLAGVSGFGFSGTNAHVIVGEAPAAADRPAAATGAVLLPLSAADEDGLARVTAAWTRRIGDATDEEIAALAATAGAGRAHLPVRRAAVGASREQLLAALGRAPAAHSPRPPRVAFLFSGQSSQYFGMGAELYRTEPVFRDVIDACAAHFGDALGEPLTDLMFAGRDRELINQTRITQPALVALELALAALWRSWGVEPVAVLGHSVGEIAAAVHAGVLTLPAGLDLITHRARLMQGTEAGAMLAVVAAPDVVAARIDGAGLDIAAVNGPQATVVAGAPDAVEAFAKELTADGIQSRPLVVSHAFHSRLMEPILPQLRAAIDGLEHARPRIPIVANVTGRLATPGQYDAGYWCEHVRRPVRFAEGVEQLRELDIDLYLEIGPGRTLGNLATAAGVATAETALASLRRGAPDRTAMLGAARSLYERGQRLDWAAVQGTGRRADAPRYPFADTRYWVPAGAGTPATAATLPSTPHWGRELRSPGLGSGRVFSFERSPQFPPYLGDHRLYGTVVTPAASHLATLLSALAPGGQPITVEDFVCPRALVIKDDERYEVQLLVSEVDGQQPRLSVQSMFDPVNGRWQEHMSGRLGAPAAAVPGAAPDPAAFIATAERHITGEQFYQQARELGYTLGPAFRWVGEAWLRGNDTLVRYRRPQLPDDPADYELYPGLIDSCFQSIAGFLGEGPDGESPELAIPFAARRLAFTGRPDADDELWGHVTVTQAAPLSQGRWRVESADIRLFTGAGRTLFTADDFRVRAASRTVLQQSLKGGPSGGYRLDHVPVAVTAAGASITVVGGGPALHAAVAALPAGDAELVADARFLDPATTSTTTATAQDARRAVWDLATSLRAASPDVPYAVLAAGGAQAAPLRQALWGMLAALEAEQPRRRLLRVTVEDGADPALLAGVLAQAAAAGVPEPCLTVGAGGAQPVTAARLVPVTSGPAIAAWPRNVLITGGLGALGLSSARLLAQQGTAAVTLLGRSAPDPAAQEVIDDLVAAGVTVGVVRGDVTDPADCARAVAAATATGPLHGVLHLAGALDDRPFDELDEASLAKVFAAKAVGAEHLAAATGGQPLTAFVLFSSASSLLGSAGQTNYGAANGFLDGLAEALRAGGVPATSVNWGPWTPAAKGGMAAADAVRRAGERLGVRPLDDEGAAPLLALAVAGELPRLLAVDLDVARYAEQVAGHPRAALVAALTDRPAGTAAPDGRAAQAKGWLRRAVDDVAPEAREAALRRAVREMLGVIVGDDGAVDESLSFAEIGLDSIMVIDLRSRLEHAMGADLPATMGIDYPTVPAITRFVHDLAYPAPADGPAAETAVGPAAETYPVAAAGADTDLSELSLDQLILAVQQDLTSQKKG